MLHEQRNNTTWQLYLWPSNWPVFNKEMGCSTSRPWPLRVRGRGLWAAVFLTAPVLSLIVLQPSKVCSPNGPSWLFAQFARLTAHLYWCGSTNLYSGHSAWLDGGGKRHSCQNHPVDQRSPKGLSSQTSWTTSISWGSAPTYRTQRTFSLLHLHSSVQPPTPHRSGRKLSCHNLPSRNIFHTDFVVVFPSFALVTFCSLVYCSFPGPRGLDFRWEEC